MAVNLRSRPFGDDTRMISLLVKNFATQLTFLSSSRRPRARFILPTPRIASPVPFFSRTALTSLTDAFLFPSPVVDFRIPPAGLALPFASGCTSPFGGHSPFSFHPCTKIFTISDRFTGTVGVRPCVTTLL